MKHKIFVLTLCTACGLTAQAGVILPGEQKPVDIYERRDAKPHPMQKDVAKDHKSAEKPTKATEAETTEAKQDKTPDQPPPLRVGMLPITHGAHPAMYSSDVELGEVPLHVHFENKPLKVVMEDVIQAVSTRTGAWDLRWRLSPDNQFIKNERVNLIAEADFETFTSFVADRIKNMTGIQLYVNVFNGSRIIAITDTYY